jgi:hypothetical protein
MLGICFDFNALKGMTMSLSNAYGRDFEFLTGDAMWLAYTMLRMYGMVFDKDQLDWIPFISEESV